MPDAYIFITEPPANNTHLTAAFAQMHVTAYNNNEDAIVKASCTPSSTSTATDFPEVELPKSENTIYLLIYVMPHKADTVITHELKVELKKKSDPTGTGLGSDSKDNIYMDSPDAPGGTIHPNFMEYYKNLASKVSDGKNNGFPPPPNHDYLPKNKLANYGSGTNDEEYIKVEKNGKNPFYGKVAGGPKKLDVTAFIREPHLKDKDNPPTPKVIGKKLNQLQNNNLDFKDVDTSAHGSVIAMEYKIDDKNYNVRFVMPVMDKQMKVDKSSKQGVYVFKYDKK